MKRFFLSSLVSSGLTVLFMTSGRGENSSFFNKYCVQMRQIYPYTFCCSWLVSMMKGLEKTETFKLNLLSQTKTAGRVTTLVCVFTHKRFNFDTAVIQLILKQSGCHGATWYTSTKLFKEKRQNDRKLIRHVTA